MEIEASLPSARKIEVVAPHRVYNLPLFESHFVIDVRHMDRFQEEHIATALHFGTSDAPNESMLSQFLWSVVTLGLQPEHVSPVVIYGDDHPDSILTLQWLAHRLSQLDSQPASMDPPPHMEAEGDSEYLVTAFKSLSKQVNRSIQKVWIVEGGYQAFKAEFPVVCGLMQDMEPLPVYIASGLFLGSRSVQSSERRDKGQLAYERAALAKLGVTHVVVDSSNPLSLEDSEGIECLRIDIPDSNGVTMSPVWNAVIQFIEEARRNGGKLLIQMHGRSRSASIMVAWMMRVLQLPFDKALQTVLDTCPYTLDTELMYLDQLKKWNPNQHLLQ